METHEYERPWQVMPAKIIKLALEHAEKDDDFDHQVAFLLLDIGVEAALKAFLVNKGHNVEKISFPELLKKVKEELPRNSLGIIREIDDIAYFHGIRNKLYHQGDGVKPTKDNLKRYSDLAKRAVEEIIEVDLETVEKKDVALVKGKEHEVEELIDIIKTRFRYFQESCAIIAEKARPSYASREFAMKLKFILHQWPDIDDEDPEDRLEKQKMRLEKFSELTSIEVLNIDMVDLLLEDVNLFYVMIAFAQISEEWNVKIAEYLDFVNRQSRLLYTWKYRDQFGLQKEEQISEEFESIVSWIKTQQNRMDEWISSHMENIYRRKENFDFLDVEDWFGQP